LHFLFGLFISANLWSSAQSDTREFKAKLPLCIPILISVLFKYYPRWCHWGFFSVATVRTMCPGVDSASKNEYQGFLLG
jgi:hypothetical protein